MSLVWKEPEPTRVQGNTGLWEIVIGMEIHAQVASKSKLFSGAATEFGANENNQVSLVDAAFPGMLPVINEYCVEQAVRTGLGLKAQINPYSVFDRKNYFYPDLPQGYQISQFKYPIVGEGEIIVELGVGVARRVGIERIHLEQDAGKSIHDQHPTMSLIDLNRSGVALMEIVSKPDLRSGEEAGAFLKKLRTILRYLGTCDGNMDQGSMRADVNVSVRRPGEELGTRCEIKNVNSVRFVQMAVDYEVRRQIEVLEEGGKIVQETRLFDPKAMETRSMRSKEEAHDYRYFPDPDLLPLQLEQSWIDNIAKDLPELPDAKKIRFMTEYGLSENEAVLLVAEQDSAHFFEKAAQGRDGKTVANWVVGELFAALNKSGLPLNQSPISPDQLGGLVALITDGTISGKIAKDVFEIMWNEGGNASEIVETRGMKQVTDTGAISAAIEAVITSSPENVVAYKSGKDKLIGWFVGQVMKSTGGKANPNMLNEMLKERLSKE
jgi:aspartyl-tRNA(Asn)/glutamyl-tRNA(Gln) amidotransferase subunit B